jgi:hypothetical protein
MQCAGDRLRTVSNDGILYEGYPNVFGLVALNENFKLSSTRCSCIAILEVNPVSFAAMTLCVVSQLVFTVVSVYFIIDSVRKLLDTPSYFLR